MNVIKYAQLFYIRIICLVLDKDGLLAKEVEHFNNVYNRINSKECDMDEKSYKAIPKFYFKVSKLNICTYTYC